MTKPVDMVIIGGSSYLAQRRLIPALYRAFCEGQLPSGSRIVASCRKSADVAHYAGTLRQVAEQNLSEEEFCPTRWSEFAKLIQAVELDVTAMDERWHQLSALINACPEQARVFYLAIPSAIFGVCCRHLAAATMVSANSRVVIEEPIGFDAASAQAINSEIAGYIAEPNVYRIDHYMGKETVQNLMALRFSNFIFEQLWDSKSIDHVQISIAETVGLEGRAGFYDKAGAMRDMVQNHLLQLLCLVAMESPHQINAANIHREKVKVLEALRPLSDEDVALHTVRGQYVAGNYLGELVPGYLEELASPASNTETFVALRAYIDNWRWARVPFYLRTGKRMQQRSAEIVIQFKEVSHRVFDEGAGPLSPNRLVIRLQPDEKIQLSLMSKNLDTLAMQLQPAELNLNFAESRNSYKSDAYKRLMLDAAVANPSLFIHRDEVELAWRWIDPIITYWQDSADTPHLYRAGSWGPDESDELLAQDGRRWYNDNAPNQ